MVNPQVVVAVQAATEATELLDKLEMVAREFPHPSLEHLLVGLAVAEALLLVEELQEVQPVVVVPAAMRLLQQELQTQVAAVAAVVAVRLDNLAVLA